MSRKSKLAGVALSAALTWAGVCMADVKPHPLFTDGVVLQAGKQVSVWGWADPGEEVTVSMKDFTGKVKAGADGTWQMSLSPMEPGGPFTMEISGKNKIGVKDVMVGEVWLCSGQSNMEQQVDSCSYNSDDIANSTDPGLRMFILEYASDIVPLKTIKGTGWLQATPRNTANFSATGYFFARAVRKATGHPIGMISASWSGSSVECWRNFGSYTTPEKFAVSKDKYEKNCAKLKADYDANPKPARHDDPGNKGEGMGFAKTDFDDSSWETLQIPARVYNIDGAFWFRKHVSIPVEWEGKELSLGIGATDDYNTAYFNGVKVGEFTKDDVNSPWYYTREHKYKVPASAVKAGDAVVAVRVFDAWSAGGMTGRSELFVGLTDGSAKIPLAGDWKSKVEVSLDPEKVKGPLNYPAPPAGSGSMFNGMIMPLTPYAMRGAIWYQGEANAGAGRSVFYQNELTSLISDWRAAFDQYLYFGIVQLPPYGKANPDITKSRYSDIREAELMTALTVPRTGMAFAIDTERDENGNLHPLNKQDIAARLALWALADVYGQKVAWKGPVYKSMKVEGDKIRLSFNNAKGLHAKGEKLEWFYIAGKDKKFVKADATIEKNGTILVASPDVPEPVAVRYAWADHPKGCNLYNGDELPASPFRTDTP